MFSDIYDHKCTLCPLHESAQTVCVEASGQKTRVRAMVVGEAPGRNEDLQGRPFVGQAGRVLDRALMKAFGGETPDPSKIREDIFVTNAVKCRPPSNETPNDSDIDTCVSAYLTREIERVDPFTILACGNVAARALLGETGITRLRGTWHRLDSERERWVLPTFHPAYCMYQGLDSEVAAQFREDVAVFAEGSLNASK